MREFDSNLSDHCAITKVEIENCGGIFRSFLLLWKPWTYNSISLGATIRNFMQYKYEKGFVDYSDLASGRVFYSSPGYPAFPVRLASEIFQRCMAHRETIYQNTTPCTLYD